MSSSEGENFDIENVSGSESDDYAPVKKTTKVAAKPKAAPKAVKAPAKPKASTSKAATKPKAAPKKKVLTDHDDNGEDSAIELDEQEDASGDDVGPLPEKQKAATGKKKTASETYTKLSQLEHILKRPDSYIGSVETITQAMWTFDTDTKRMVHRDVKYVPGFFKIVDEILVNAADNKINDASMDTLKINIDIEECTISVYNNGRGIPIEMHSTEKMYIPELIFGHLLSSSNYDDDEKKLTGGRNGYGAKLANIYSHEFTVETADKNTQLKYKQTWTDNMSVCGKPKITKNGKGEEWTRVTFKPDLKRFGMDKIDEDTAGLLRKRVYDMAGTVKDVKVFLNDERLKIKNFKQYVEMYLQSAHAEAAETSGGAAQAKPTVIYEQISARWEIAFAVSEGTFQFVSFANSISTTKGGTHVTYISDQIAKNLVAAIAKKNKAATVKPAQIKNHMWIFVNALIENPTFDSQTKETLTLPASKFGTKPVLSEEFLKKVQKSSIIDNILNWAKYKADQQIKRTDGTKRSRLIGLTKLSDANNAGTKHAKNCTLILTEGDSAKALAVAGLGVVGRDNFGVFPLRGKLLNVREARHEQIMKNEEIQNIKKIMGLQHNKDYTNTMSLRYGRLMIMTDQDHDGSHIKGLIINFLDHFYPSLLKLPEFLVEFVTPIVRVTKGKQRHDFFTIPEYEQWLEETPSSDKWEAKYFKGLGTSTDADARDYFGHMKKHMIPFAPTQDGDKELIDLAFSKKKADDRKEWLRHFKPGTYLDHRLEEIPYSEFINKELILFSMADNIRSIPSVADGLKPGQRKVMWACFKRKLKKEIKVAQLVGYIGEQAAYHHGEVSLAQTIVNLAQNFVGSNNLNLLDPRGQYGTREQGGKNHASPRYIFTQPMAISRVIFNPADDALLNAQKDDNMVIEPEWYMPIVPMVLINGAEGIGTGWSTTIPCYNPTDIVMNLRRLMNGEEVVPMLPWWRGFKGEIKPVAKHKYDVTGVVRKVNDTTVEITELPIHVWTEKFKADLEAMIVGETGKDGVIKDYKEHHDNTNVHFIVTMGAKELERAEEQGLLEFFKLTGKLNTSNMICFDFEGKIRKYDSPEEILEEFYPMRLAYYQKRKDFLASEIQNALEKLTNQARFIQMIVDNQLVVSKRKKAEIVADLRRHNFRAFPKVAAAKKAGETMDALEDEDEQEDDDDDDMDVDADSGKGKGKGKGTGGEAGDYDYLLGMAIYSLTREKIEKLKMQADDKERELLALLEKTPKSMWNEDLDRFLLEWELDCKTFFEATEKDAKGKKVKRKQAVLQTRKSIGGRKGSDDDDDDFKPIKATAAKRKVVGESSRPKAAPKKPKDEDEDVEMGEAAEKPKSKPAAPKRKAAEKKKVVKDESDESDGGDYLDDDDDVVQVSTKAVAAKRKTTSKPIVIDSDSDDEVVVVQAKGKAKAAPKRKSTGDDDSDDDDFIKPASKGKGKAVETTKRKSTGTATDDSDDELYVKPAAKKKKVTDFFEKAGPAAKKKEPAPTARKISKSMKPASPPKPKPKTKAKVAHSDSDEDMDYDALPVPKKTAAPARAARTAVKKYIELSDDDEDEKVGDDSLFEDD
ncbi:DNA topoisomerase 2 [Hypsizygus marmoreus]|uniref:DNA topoisomerase 2 n=1 Tax=Hypsizygus marmoreus TaxID=39966 RepID=A0A369K9W6_HYPMA|nr:DNA topoisomerase 2 [Hypsizygus marmoreus]